MKKFSQLLKESKDRKKITLKDSPVNYLSVDELKKYLEVADKFLCSESKEVCNWLIENNEYYKKNINSLLDFFNSGFPKEENLRKLYSNINKVNETGRVKEIPVFMTSKEFNDIIEKKIPADLAIMDFESEQGRNDIVRRYTPLVHKIVNSWIGKTALDKDELFAAGLRGIAEAMKIYGKKSDKAVKREMERIEKAKAEAEENGKDFDEGEDFSGIDLDKYMSYTFLQLAAQYIRICILEDAKDNSHLVKIPRSRQRKDKDEKGFVAKSNSVSGDKKLGSKDGGDGKSLFDIVGGIENPTKELDKRQIDDLWKEITDELEAKFGEKTMDIFYNHFGWGGRQKLSGKDMAKKYGYNSPSSITAEITKVLNFIRKDKKMFAKFQDINELMSEAKHDEDEYENDNEPIYINTHVIKEFNGLNDVDEN